jgi:hypothetical protein
MGHLQRHAGHLFFAAILDSVHARQPVNVSQAGFHFDTPFGASISCLNVFILDAICMPNMNAAKRIVLMCLQSNDLCANLHLEGFAENEIDLNTRSIVSKKRDSANWRPLRKARIGIAFLLGLAAPMNCR